MPLPLPLLEIPHFCFARLPASISAILCAPCRFSFSSLVFAFAAASVASKAFIFAPLFDILVLVVRMSLEKNSDEYLVR